MSECDICEELAIIKVKQLEQDLKLSILLTGVGALVAALPPSGNYWNPLDAGGAVVLSNGDKDATGDSASSVRSVTSHASGKYYFEVLVSGAESYIGIANAAASVTTDPIGFDADGVSVACESGNVWENGGSTAYAAGASGGEVYGIAADLDGSKFYVAIDGVWQNSADPAAGTGGYAFSVTGAYFMGLTPDFSATNLRSLDGDFTQTKPTGFSAWG